MPFALLIFPLPLFSRTLFSFALESPTVLTALIKVNVGRNSYEAYSPLRRVNLSDPKISAIGAKHNATTAQVALRWITQQDCPVATSPGVNEAYSIEDLNLGSFALSAAEMAALSAM